MHPARLCGGFRTIFFCLVCGPLEKKKKKNHNYYCSKFDQDTGTCGWQYTVHSGQVWQALNVAKWLFIGIGEV